MTIHENLATLHGHDVVDFEAGMPSADPMQKAVRLTITYDGPFKEFSDLWAEFMNSTGVEQTQALVIGNWSNPDDGPTSSEQAVALIVSSADRLANLRALFFGDITSEENEISWIEQSDLSALWGAFPHLEELGVRGGNHLQLGGIRHANLRTLKVEAGGCRGLWCTRSAPPTCRRWSISRSGLARRTTAVTAVRRIWPASSMARGSRSW